MQKGLCKSKMRQAVTRAEAADRLAKMADQLREGSISLQTLKVAVADDVQLQEKLEDDEFKIELKWRPVND
jgi:amphi-Trp domain-containing protein